MVTRWRLVVLAVLGVFVVAAPVAVTVATARGPPAHGPPTRGDTDGSSEAGGDSGGGTLIVLGQFSDGASRWNSPRGQGQAALTGGGWTIPTEWREAVGDEALDHERRAAIYDVVARSPGTYVAAIADDLDTPRSTVRYHLRVLEREGLVTDQKVRGRRRFVPVNADGAAVAAALEDEATRSVLHAVGRLDPATVTRLADHVGRAPSTVSYHLDRLGEEGLLERERVGGEVHVHLTQRTRERLDDGSPRRPLEAARQD